jgi:hypothetical protein
MRYYGIDLHSDCMTVAVMEHVDGVWKNRTFAVHCTVRPSKVFCKNFRSMTKSWWRLLPCPFGFTDR